MNCVDSVYYKMNVMYLIAVRNMPNHIIQQPKTLESRAVTQFKAWIELQARNMISMSSKPKDLTSHRIEAICDYINCNMPYNLHDRMASEAIQALLKLSKAIETSGKGDEKGNHDIIGQMISMWLSFMNLTSLALTDKGKYVPLFSNASLVNLTRLELTDFKEVEVVQLIKGLHNLKSFKYWKFCTENVLRSLVENCKLVEEVDIAYSDKINNKSMDIFAGLSELRIITIFMTKTDPMGIKTLLLLCKNIEHIKTHRSEFVIDALQLISPTIHDGRRFNVKVLGKIRYDSPESLDILQIAIKLCPLIEEICFYQLKVWNNRDEKLSLWQSLSSLKSLHKLQLNEFHFTANHVERILEATGSNLLELKVIIGHMDLNALMSITHKCPNLEKLTIDVTDNSGADWSLENVKKMSVLRNLKFFSLKGESKMQGLMLVLSKCPKVEHISIDYGFSLTDYIMLKILDDNPLCCLKRLNVFQNKLSMMVLDRLFQNCSGLEVVDTYSVPQEESDPVYAWPRIWEWEDLSPTD